MGGSRRERERERERYWGVVHSWVRVVPSSRVVLINSAELKLTTKNGNQK
jgi:hypothetical protein